VFRDPQVFLKPDDVVTVEIEGIGRLVNPVSRWRPRG
jgi:2-keto-4-pentenoate hydratase/2-oxohepta-3-ene-1,7-dioic acid hydratase in catechol pathway